MTSTYITRFGPLEITDTHIWKCIAPMPGFTELQHFALLHLPAQGPFVWLQSLDDPIITFLLMAPDHFGLRYNQVPHFAKEVSAGLPMVMVILPNEANASLQTNGQAPLYFLPEKKMFGQWIVEHQELNADNLCSAQTPPAILNPLTVISAPAGVPGDQDNNASLSVGAA